MNFDQPSTKRQSLLLHLKLLISVHPRSRIQMPAKTSQPLKQGTIPFLPSKRTGSSTPANVKAKISRSTKASPAQRSVSSSSSSANEVDVEDVHLTSDEEVPEEHKKLEERPATTNQVSSTKSSTKKATTKTETPPLPKVKQENISPVSQERPELKEKDPRWKEHYAVVREKMNYKKPSM